MRHDRNWKGTEVRDAPERRSLWRTLLRLGAGERRPEPLHPRDYPQEWRRDAVARPVAPRHTSR